MKMTLICPNCREQGNYIKDEKLEDKGWYTFRCECGEEYITPKENPLIEREENNNAEVYR